MKRLLVAASIALFAIVAFAQEETPQPAKPKDSDLVAASKASTRKKAKPKHVITNDDVKKSKGKLTVAEPKKIAGPAVAEVEVTSPKTSAEETALYNKRVAAQERVALAEKKVAELEHELATIEQDYYEENDPAKRDKEITRRFAQTKKQLADARTELGNAREDAEKIK